LVLTVIVFYVHSASGSLKLLVCLLNVSEKLRWMNGNAFALFVGILICSFFCTDPQVWRSWDRTSLMYFLSITNKMQRYTIFFITCLLACLLLPPAVAASKLDIYPMLCVQFLSSWWWAEKPPETFRALTVIKNIV